MVRKSNSAGNKQSQGQGNFAGDKHGARAMLAFRDAGRIPPCRRAGSTGAANAIRAGPVVETTVESRVKQAARSIIRRIGHRGNRVRGSTLAQLMRENPDRSDGERTHRSRSGDSVEHETFNQHLPRDAQAARSESHALATSRCRAMFLASMRLIPFRQAMSHSTLAGGKQCEQALAHVGTYERVE